MATDAGRLLTAQHRRAQVQLRAGALRDYLAVWPVWSGSSESFARLVEATIPLVRVHHRLSATLAGAFYQSIRAVERPGGLVTPRLAEFDAEAFAGTLYLTGAEMTRRALAAGQSPEAARRTALVRTSGTVGRFVLEGGRTTIAETAESDRAAVGYRRVVGPNACSFCRLLDGRTTTGPFAAHDHCACGSSPVFS